MPGEEEAGVMYTVFYNNIVWALKGHLNLIRICTGPQQLVGLQWYILTEHQY